MGLDDKTGNAAEKLGGKGKEAAGDESLKAAGQGDQAKSNLVQGGETVEDAPREAAGDEGLKAAGQGDQAKSNLVQGGDDVKDTFKKH